LIGTRITNNRFIKTANLKPTSGAADVQTGQQLNLARNMIRPCRVTVRVLMDSLLKH
jgi:hypothetical protein